jgi:hypothetical protein
VAPQETYTGRLIDSLLDLVEKAEKTRRDQAAAPANTSPLTIDEVLRTCSGGNGFGSADPRDAKFPR